MIKDNILQFHVAYTEYPLYGTTFRDLYNKTIIALNYSKVNDGGTYTPYSPFIEDKLKYEDNFKGYLKDAIDAKDFYVVYQAKYNSLTENVFGLEALARWGSKKLGSVSPGDFVPMITKYNMINEFERVIIEKVLNDFSVIHDLYGVDVKVGINISPDHLTSGEFVPFILEAYKKYNVSPSRFMFEITEEVMLNGIKVLYNLISIYNFVGKMLGSFCMILDKTFKKIQFVAPHF